MAEVIPHGEEHAPKTEPRPSLVEMGITLFGATAFAIAQPLFDLLSGHVEFLIAHRIDPLDLIAITALLCIVPAALALLLTAAVGLVARSARRAATCAIVGVAVAATALPPLDRTFALPDALDLGLALALGAAAAYAFARVDVVRTFTRTLGICAVGLPLWFLFGSPASALFWGAPAADARITEVRGSTPVVLVIFDQFPLFTLLRGNEEIDAARFPNFAALAADADWFRNATTVATETTMAVPAIVTGRYPDRPRLPRFSDHPQNLFTLLGHDYRLNVVQTMTDLCPPLLCPEAAVEEPRGSRLRAVLADLQLLYLHLLLPEDLRGGLQDVGSTWRNFQATEWIAKDATPGDPHASWGDPSTAFERFLSRLQPPAATPEQRVLHFLHLNLPHVPWKYLPSGAVYGPVGRHLYPYPMNGLADVGAGDREALDRALQRHLLQVSYTDKLLGRLIERLKDVGLYDTALLIVTADHGITFWPGTLSDGDDRMASDILNIPLFVKRPGQRNGALSDANVEIVDILPTIAAELDFELPEPVDGRALYRQKSSRDGKRVFVDLGNGQLQRADYPSQIPGRRLSIHRVERVFGLGDDPNGLFAIGRHKDWIGMNLGALPVRAAREAHRVELANALAFARVALDEGFVPARVTGEIYAQSGTPPPAQIAIAINGVLWASTATFRSAGGAAGFEAMVPESSFVRGANRVEVFAVSGVGEDAVLHPTNQGARRSFALAVAENGEVLRTSRGVVFPIVAGAIDGAIESHGPMLAGWARDASGDQIPESVVLFVNGHFYEERDLSRARDEVVTQAHVRDPDQKTLWFDAVIPFEQLREAVHPELRVFAISGGIASELEPLPGFAYRGEPAD